jgi:hypothetical protein
MSPQAQEGLRKPKKAQESHKKYALIEPIVSGTLPPPPGPVAMSSLSKDRKIVWIHVLTVVSAAILIGAEVFGAAFAGSWAVSNLMGLGPTGALILDIVFVLLGVVVMFQFIRAAQKVEPFTTRG